MSFLAPEPTRLGIVCLARLTFEADLAAQWYAQAQTVLRNIADVQLYPVAKLVIEANDADAAIAELRAANVDALIILNGTFALGGLAMRLAQALPLPLLLWAWPEPKEQTGKLRLNSLVGAHVNASNLYKLGYRPVTLYAALDDPRTLATVSRFARIAGVLRDLRRLRIGLIGGHAPGFDNLGINKLALRRALGVEVVEIGLQTVVNRAKGIAAERVKAAKGELLQSFDDTSELSPLQGELYAGLVLALKEIAADLSLDALAIKCWGDLVESYGIAGCGVVAHMNDTGLLVGCEGDVMGTITALIAQRLTGTPAFLTDLVAIDGEQNTGFLWHIGCAPLSLAAPGQPRHLFSHFAGGKGVTAGFALKPGRVTILRLGDDGHSPRLFAISGQALATEMDIRGTVSRVRFDSDANAFLDELLSNGWEHHVVMAYGELIPDLELLSRSLNIPLTVLK